MISTTPASDAGRHYHALQLRTDIISVWIRSAITRKAFGKRHILDAPAARVRRGAALQHSILGEHTTSVSPPTFYFLSSHSSFSYHGYLSIEPPATIFNMPSHRCAINPIKFSVHRVKLHCMMSASFSETT